MKFRPLLYMIFLGMYFLSACSGFGNTYPTDVFIPPTRVPTQPPTATAPIEATNPPNTASTPTAPTPCNNNLIFLSDLTLPDGSEVRTSTTLDKRWKVKNAGDCNWNADYRVRLVTGPALGAPEEQALYPARGGSEATIRIIFTAPEEEGNYQSAWQAYTPDGQAFGDPVYIDVMVIP